MTHVFEILYDMLVVLYLLPSVLFLMLLLLFISNVDLFTSKVSLNIALFIRLNSITSIVIVKLG